MNKNSKLIIDEMAVWLVAAAWARYPGLKDVEGQMPEASDSTIEDASMMAAVLYGQMWHLWGAEPSLVLESSATMQEQEVEPYLKTWSKGMVYEAISGRQSWPDDEPIVVLMEGAVGPELSRVPTAFVAQVRIPRVEWK